MAFIDGALPGRRLLDARAALRAMRGSVVATSTTVSWVIVALVVVLNLIGLVMILSASSVQALTNYGSAWYVFERQFAWAVIGAVAFFVASRLDYRFWQRHSRLLLAVGFIGLLVVLVPGVGIEVEGARRWVGLGSTIGFQPSEIAKIVLLVFTADVLTRRGDRIHDTRATVFPVIAVLGVFAALVMAEPDLATSIELGFIVVSVLVVAGVPSRALAKVFGGTALLTAVFALIEPYRRQRMFTFMHPWHDVANKGYQISQSLIALGSGGATGAGLGNGRAKWQFLPAAQTDFIFAIIGEELGLFGTLMIVGLFAVFAVAGYRVAMRAPDRFGALLAAGVTTWVVGAAVLNIGMVTSVLPVSGVPLPFLSAGGSSLVILMVAAGILVNVARRCEQRGAARPA
ncbi:MAG: cell division protein FtsW [Actinomycetota bacterium]|nr:cell division protein FtsW [Actinomycetota bacterium]